MKKYILLIAVIAVLGSSGCKSWMDINQNPNDASSSVITMGLLLPAAEYNMLDAQVYSTYAAQLAQYQTKSGEYSGNYPILTGNILPQNMDSWWESYYQQNSNLTVMYDKAIEQEDRAYEGIALTLLAINYQRMVDIWQNIPYTQACRPSEFTNPEYDDGATIYADLISNMDKAVAAFDAAITGNYDVTSLRSVDFITNGDLQLWKKIAYTIKLRLLMRISNVQDVSSQVAAIADKCLDIYENVEANPGYYVETGKMNIFYEGYGWDKNGGQNTNHRQYMPTAALVDMLRDNNDPRLRVYADPRTQLGNDVENHFSDYEKYGLDQEYYVGIPFGQQNPSRMKYTCTTGTGILAGSSDKANGRLRADTFISGAEVGFLLAEAALRGMIPGGDSQAKQYYEDAVKAAMKRHEKAMQDPSENYGLTGMRDPIPGTAEEAAEEYLSQDDVFMNWDKMTSSDQKLEAICSQKWLSFFDYNNLEGWSEMRRTDLPKLKASNQAFETKWICRLPYPQTERNLNTQNVSKQPEVDPFNSTVFWDTKNDLIERTELYL